jgi:hypothetical protein
MGNLKVGNKSVVQVVFVLSVARCGTRCSTIARETFMSIFSIYFGTYCSNNGGSMIMYRFCMLLDQYAIYILPPCQIIRQLCILRQTLTINFS